MELLPEIIGEHGFYQYFVFFFVVCTGFIAPWHHFLNIFIGPPTAYWCSKPDSLKNVSDKWWIKESGQASSIDYSEGKGSCAVRDTNYSNIIYNITSNSSGLMKSCSSYDFDQSEYSHTIINKWDLVCDSHSILSISISMYFVGSMFGVLSMGLVSDKVGRKRTLLACLVLWFCTSIASAVAENYIFFIIMRFLAGLFNEGGFIAEWILFMEVCCSRQRTILGNFASTGFALGFGAFAGIAYFVRDWQYLTLIASAPIVILFIYACFLSESPLWLISQGQVTEAKEVILKIAKMNNIKNIDEAKLKKILHKHQEDLETETKSSVSLIDVFYTPNMRKKTLIMYFIWLVNALVYYGLTVNVGDLNGNVYIHFTLSGIVELPAYLLTILVMLKFGKRSPTSCAFFIGGISLLLTLIVPKKLTWLLVTLSMIGKFGISASFVMTYVYSSELFPTVIRNIGIGSSSMIGRLGSIASPFISDLGNSNGKFIPPTLYGVSALIAGLLVLLLPETQNMDLPETLEEGEEFGRKVEPDKNVEMQIQSPSV